MEPRIVQTLFKCPAITEDKEENGEYEAKDLHKTDPIESTQNVMLQCVTKSTKKKPSKPIYFKILKMK